MTLQPAEAAPGDARPKAKIFISYSRKDLAFVDRLDAALRARGFEPLVDRAEIYAFELWWKRLEGLISKADTIVFVLSPEAVTSEYCAKEVEYAASLNKRIAPIVSRRVDGMTVPKVLGERNYIYFDDEARFDDSMAQLAEALTTDIEWVRRHTEFGEVAQRWAAAGRPGPRGLLLRSPTLEEAEQWIASRPANAPPPTEATQTFIAESRKAVTRRRNILSASLGAGLIVALLLGGVAVWKWRDADEQRAIAEKNEKQSNDQRDRALLTQSRFLADLANQKNSNRDAGTAILLALEALPDTRAGIARPYAPEAEFVLDVGRRRIQEIRLLRGHADYVLSAMFSADGKHVLTASSDQTARLWEAESGKEIAVLRGHEGFVSSAVFSADGKRVLTASDDWTARVWEAASGKALAVLRGHEGDVVSAAFSPDGARVVTASYDKTARVWEAASGKELAVLRGHESDVWRAVFSQDGKRVLTASLDKTARLWDAESGKEVAVLRGHEGEVWRAVFSADGKRVLTASSDQTARLWEAESGKEIAVLRGHEDNVWSAVFSPDGQRVLTASLDKTARLWRAFRSKEELIDESKRAVPRCLTRGQREQAFLDPEPPAWCIEMEKWPYHTQVWKEWLADKRAGKSPTLPAAQ